MSDAPTKQSEERLRKMDGSFQVLEGIDIAKRTSEMLQRCTRSIKVMQFIIRDVRVVKRSRFDPLSVKLFLFRNIASKANRGVETRFLIRFKRSRYNRQAESFQEKVAKQLKSLESKIEIRLCPEIHQKLLIVDDREAWLGSANLNYRGMGGKRDLILWTNDRQVVGKLTEIFNRRWMQKDDVCRYCPKKCIIVA